MKKKKKNLKCKICGRFMRKTGAFECFPFAGYRCVKVWSDGEGGYEHD